MAAEIVSSALAGSLSNDRAARTKAELVLAPLAAFPDHAQVLLHLAAAPDAVVAQAAALRLKNLLRRSQTATAAAAVQQRALVRPHIVDALAAVAGSNVSGMLAESLRLLILVDFPGRWPDLVQKTQAMLTSGVEANAYAALVTLRMITKCYEFKNRDPTTLDPTNPNEKSLQFPRQPLEHIAELFLPHLQRMLVDLDAVVARTAAKDGAPAPSADALSATRRASKAQRLVIKIFWSCVSFLIPPALDRDGALDGWMGPLLTTLGRPCAQYAVDDRDDLALESEWKTKRWIAETTVRLVRRHGNPRRVPVDEPWSKRVAERIQNVHATNATQAMVQVLMEPLKGRQLSKPVAHYALDMMEEVVETAALWKAVLPHVDTLLNGIVFPYLCFDEEDMSMWVADPIEYVRKQHDFADDLTSPRTTAANLLSRMSELRADKTISPFLAHITQNVLEPYRLAAVGSKKRLELSRQKVGAFAALAAVKTKLISRKIYSNSFLEVLANHVEPDLNSEFGYVKAEAVWLLGQVSSSGWDAFTTQLGEKSLRGCFQLLQDTDVPVRAAAAAALEHLLDQPGSAMLVKPVAVQLLQRLMELMEELSDGIQALLPAVDTLVQKYPDETMPSTMDLLRVLIKTFNEVARNCVETDSEDDDRTYVAGQILNLVTMLINYYGQWQHPTLEEKTEGLLQIERQLQPLLTASFEVSHQAFAEELYEVLDMLIVEMGELQDGLSPFLLSLIPKIGAAFDGWAVDHIPQLRKPVESFLSFDITGVMDLDGGINAISKVTLKLWAEDADDSDILSGTKIADVLIINLCKVSPSMKEEACASIIAIAQKAATKCVSLSSNDEGLQLRLFGTVMCAIYFNAHAVASALGPASIVQLISKCTENIDALGRVFAKKQTVLGISSLLRQNDLGIEEAKPSLLRVALELRNRIEEQRNVIYGSPSKKTLEMFQTFGHLKPVYRDDPDLRDDEDASVLDTDVNGAEPKALESLAVETGVSAEALAHLSGNGRIISHTVISCMDDSDDDDEGRKNHVIDEINETSFLLICAKEGAGLPWWGGVGENERRAMQELAGRYPM